MAKLSKMVMAGALTQHQHIAVSRSMFGLKQTVTYTQTQSAVTLFAEEYSAEDGARLEKLLNLTPVLLVKELNSKGKPQPAALGPYRLEVCVSEDHQFCACQLFHFIDFSYAPSTDLKFYEGKDAEMVSAIVR